MTVIQARVKRWGNSFGIIIPSESAESGNIREGDNIKFLILKDSRDVFKKTFGLLRGKIKKSSQEMKNELRKELY